jgi:hypothetical protein
MLENLAMSTTVRNELLWSFTEPEDPEVEARRQQILEVLLSVSPQVKQRLIDEGAEKGRLVEARAALRSVLARRVLLLSSEEDRRIEACADLATLERWLAQAVTAPSAAAALQ